MKKVFTLSLMLLLAFSGLLKANELLVNSECEPPTDLYGEFVYNSDDSYGALLQWPYEWLTPLNEWLFYDDGTNVNAVGLEDNGSFYWGIMLPPSMLNMQMNTDIWLSKVSMFDYEAHTGKIMIYRGGSTAPETLIYQQNYSVSGSGTYVEFELGEPVMVDLEQNLWVVMNNDNGHYVASAGENTGNPNGRWISLDGSEWIDVASEGLDYSWNLRAFFTNTIVEEPVIPAGLDHFNIYRSTTNSNYELIGEAPADATTYFDDRTGEPGYYYYQVTAVYIESGEECESNPATGYVYPDDNYVRVEVLNPHHNVNETSLENVEIYPNPADGELNIKAEGMTRITVNTISGQTIYDQEASGDKTILDMSSYESGIYMIRIMTENGIIVKRIVVK